MRKGLAVDPAAYDAYVGEYEVEAAGRLKVIKEGNRLFFELA